MDRIAKALSAHDEAYQEMAQLLFGGGADELISKISPDQSDVSAAQKKKHQRQAQVGLASNVLGLTAGTVGLAAASKDPRLAQGGKLARTVHGAGSAMERGAKKTRWGQKYYRNFQEAGGKYAAGMAGGAVGLQAANLGGDVVANRVLARSANEGKPKKKVVKSADRNEQLYLNKGKLVAVAAKKGQPKLIDMGNEIKAKQRAGDKVQPPEIGNGQTSGKVHKADTVDVVWEGEFSKMDTDKRQVFGWASVVEVNGEPVADLQGDIIDAGEIEKAAYEYVQKSRKGGDMHKRLGDEPYHASTMIESFMVTPEKLEKMGLPPSSLPTGWWVGYQVHDDDLWQEVKKGRRTGFSIHGRGRRIPSP